MALVVNGERIEDSLIEQEVERLRPYYERTFANQSAEQQRKQLLDWSRENVIERVLISQQARKHCGPIPRERIEVVFGEMKKRYGGGGQLPKELDAETSEKIKEVIELQIKVERLLEDVCREVPEPSQRDITEFYEENKERFGSAERVRVAHIVKHIDWRSDEAAAYGVIKKAQDDMEKGAVFEMLVGRYSDCSENAGDLGYIGRGQMAEEFEDVVFNLGIGQTSGIFRTRFGFHIAKVYDRTPMVVPGLEEVKEKILNELKEQMRGEAINGFVDGLKAKAEIEGI